MYTLIAQTIQQLDLKLSIFSHVGYLDGETKHNKKVTKHYRYIMYRYSKHLIYRSQLKISKGIKFH